MDFQVPDDVWQLKEAVRSFVDSEVIPTEEEIEREDRIPERVLGQMREMGLFGITIPTEYGGIGIGPMAYAMISEEIGRAHCAIRNLIGVNNGIGSKALVSAGTEEQKQRLLPRLASGEFIAAFALSEPNAGSDVSSIETTAVRKGDRYVLNGIKHFITNGPYADVITVMAVTDKSAAARSAMTAFLVEKGAPGLRVGRVQETMGSRGCGRCELIFDDCEVPVESVVGEEGRGFQVAMSCLEEGRIAYAASCVGLAQRLLDLSSAYACSRVQFRRPIARFQAIQFMLAEMATSIYAARTATYHAAWKCEQGDRCGQEASMAKLFASETAGRAADGAVQIHGAMGYAKGLPVERLYRDARLFRIAEGTSEIQKVVIARELLR